MVRLVESIEQGQEAPLGVAEEGCKGMVLRWLEVVLGVDSRDGLLVLLGGGFWNSVRRGERILLGPL